MENWTDAQALSYIASYADLRAAFGADPEAGRNHFKAAGAAEGRTILFDPLSYIASYPDLVRAFGTDAAAGARHYLQAGLQEGRTANFDALSYIASYPDLIRAFGTDSAAGARHYIQAGMQEGRAVGFDALSYIASYPDLIKAFGTDAAAGARHYIQAGRQEGRAVGFDALSYIASYPDLIKAFGTDAAAGARHYIQAGRQEGRAVGFDALSYIASYPDLIEAFGTDAAAGARHYIQAGRQEGRAVGFDALSYIASYPDLIKAFGTDAVAGARHYIQAGMQEGRAITFDSVAYLLSHPDLTAAGLNSGAALRHWVESGYAQGRSKTGAFGNEQTNHVLSKGAQVSGVIDSLDDKDWYQLDLVAEAPGNYVTVQVSGIIGFLSLRNAKGQEVASGQEINYTAAQSGTYYVVVSSAPFGPTKYTLRATQFSQPIGTSVNDTLVGANGADILVGLEGDDFLDGRGGADILRGMGGDDTLDGRDGNDLLEGGAGNDALVGGEGDDILYGNNAGNIGLDNGNDRLVDYIGGNDQLYGQDGDDYIHVERYNDDANTLVLDGGAGNDNIIFDAVRSSMNNVVTIFGGPGNDLITTDGSAKFLIDAGDGDDDVKFNTSDYQQTITLGAGADRLIMSYFFFTFGDSLFSGIDNPTVITDFAIGSDTLTIDSSLMSLELLNWDPLSNPFGTGHLKLVQNGADTDLMVDRDGSASSEYRFAKLLTFANTTAASFTEDDLGYAPDGKGQTIIGTSGNDSLFGTVDADILQGLGGADNLDGRAGDDVLEGGAGYDILDGRVGNDILYGNNAENIGADLDGDRLTDYEGGNDHLYGQDGDDYLYITRLDDVPSNTVLLDGGSGNDSITFYTPGTRIDTVSIFGGSGNDSITADGLAKFTIDAGEGDDEIFFSISDNEHKITLGAGTDRLTYSSANTDVRTTFTYTTIITDFSIGTDKLIIDSYLAKALIGWDKISNPFGTGHLKLVQNGADTDLMIDLDGSISDGYSVTKFLTFNNSVASSFSIYDFGYAPDGAVSDGQIVIGTNDADTLTGTNVADVIRGLDGDDVIHGRNGDDILEGGLGLDRLEGGPGNDILYGNGAQNIGLDSADNLMDAEGGDDQLYGQDGDDYLTVVRNGNEILASNVLLDGGAGKDTLSFYSSRYNEYLAAFDVVDKVTLIGGSGNDTISVAGALQADIDAGEGNDAVIIDVNSKNQTITLGIGADVLSLRMDYSNTVIANEIRVTDFATGTDTLSIDYFLERALQGWNKVTNPFATGHLKIVQNGADTDLMIDRDGAAANDYNFAKLVTFENRAVATFTTSELGYAPDGSADIGKTIIGSVEDDFLIGTNSDDVVRGLDENDTLHGRGGDDILEGGPGYDQLDGGAGNDVLYGNNPGNTASDFNGDVLRDDSGGNDQFYGQDGGDRIEIFRLNNILASIILADGGDGDDYISYESRHDSNDTVTLNGGAGNDVINVGRALKSTIDAGDGNDFVNIQASPGTESITLGAGADTLWIQGFFASEIGGIFTVTDFEIGTDKLEFSIFLSNTQRAWDRATNPFAAGYLKLIQNGANTDLMIDRDGSVGNSYGFDKLLTFENTVAANFTAADLGYAPVAASASSFTRSMFSMEGGPAKAANLDVMISPASPFGDFGQDIMMLKIDTTEVSSRDAMAIALEKSPNFDWQGGADAVGLTEIAMVHVEDMNRAQWFAHSKFSLEAVI
ncbi:calcium-binding protein [Sphingorhabdus sp.]|uniref:calcium-binding protein n=1 Tax=Sphingorhabdus sp. TaxID=1902408 RepID=UPI0037C7C730